MTTNNSGTQPGSGKPWKQQHNLNTQQSGDITDWHFYDEMPRSAHSQTITTKNRVYLLGGYIHGASSAVYSAEIGPDGNIWHWEEDTPLPSGKGMSQAIITKNRVYLLGGCDENDVVDGVYTAPINPDGTLGGWTTDTSLPGPLGYSQAIVTSSRVYLLGGWNGSYVSTVYVASIKPDGTLGEWTTDTSLPGALGQSQAVVTSSRVYLLGGYNGNSYTSIVYTASINPDGTLGSWTEGTPLPVALTSAQVVVTSARVYLIGGYSGEDGYLPTVYNTPVNPDGTLGTWTEGTPLPVGLCDSQAIVTSSTVYLLGGRESKNCHGAAYMVAAPFSGGLNDYCVMR